MKVADNAITERFGGRTRTKLGDFLVMLEAMGGDLEEDLTGFTGEFHPEIYLAAISKRTQRRRRQKQYARSDVLLTPPKQPYSREELGRVAAGLQELRLLDRDMAYRRAACGSFIHRVRSGGVDPERIYKRSGRFSGLRRQPWRRRQDDH
jgi:hypothetical protein